MKSRDRLMAIKTTGFRKIGKVILWTLVIFLLFKGVVSILDNRDQDEMLKTIDDYRSAAEQREAARSGAAAFAENFVYEYYSFDGQSNNDYTDRIGRYLAGSVIISKPMGTNTATEVLSAKTTKISFAGQDRIDVDVSAKVRYTAVENTTGGALQDKDLNIRVPVAYKDGKYAVDAAPIFIPKEDAADVEGAETYTGTEVSQAEKQELRQVLESFLATYYEGSDQEVFYYISKDSPIKHGLNGAFAFSGIKRMSAYELSEEGKYLVDTAVAVLDNGQEIEQNMYIYLSKEGDKIYINQITTRVK
jgi:hypothetical protein